LNFLGYLSGIATGTRQYVQKVRGTKAVILDTRKTTPGLRALEKYAVRCGGGGNHRSRLDQMVLMKDNHRAACGRQWNIAETVARLRKQTKKKIEIEVDNLTQFKQILSALPNMILLDNMTNAQMKRAVRLVKGLPRKKRPLLEASGGVTLSNVAGIARTGVDRISVGALTHTHKAVNMSMELHFQ
jgi:nicotinate-nucleotide pyrophosphorylase (carboxylating)